MNQQFIRITFQIMLTALTMIIADRYMDGIHFQYTWMAIVSAAVLALLNYFIKPLLVALTIPATIFTLGLFLLVINAGMILMASQLVGQGFRVDGFWSAFWLSMWISIVNSLFGGKVQVQVHRGPQNDD